MKEEEKKQHGGKRPGAGRPKGAGDKLSRKRGEPTEARNVTMSITIWGIADGEIEKLGMTRRDFFERAVLRFSQEKNMQS